MSDTKKDLTNQINIMKASQAGAPIIVKAYDARNWMPVENPAFNWGTSDYKVSLDYKDLFNATTSSLNYSDLHNTLYYIERGKNLGNSIDYSVEVLEESKADITRNVKLNFANEFNNIQGGITPESLKGTNVYSTIYNAIYKKYYDRCASIPFRDPQLPFLVNPEYIAFISNPDGYCREKYGAQIDSEVSTLVKELSDTVKNLTAESAEQTLLNISEDTINNIILKQKNKNESDLYVNNAETVDELKQRMSKVMSDAVEQYDNALDDTYAVAYDNNIRVTIKKQLEEKEPAISIAYSIFNKDVNGNDNPIMDWSYDSEGNVTTFTGITSTEAQALIDSSYSKFIEELKKEEAARKQSDIDILNRNNQIEENISAKVDRLMDNAKTDLEAFKVSVTNDINDRLLNIYFKDLTTSKITSESASIINADITKLNIIDKNEEQKDIIDVIDGHIADEVTELKKNFEAEKASINQLSILDKDETFQNISDIIDNRISDEVTELKKNFEVDNLTVKNPIDGSLKIGLGKTITFRVNYSDFSTPNLGEVYTCGFDTEGNEKDIPGYVIVNGTKYYAKGMTNSGAAMDGYLVIPTTATGTSTAAAPVYAYDYAIDGWYYIANSLATPSVTQITDKTKWVAIAKVHSYAAEGTVTLTSINPCLLSAIEQPMNLYYEGIVATTTNYSASITPYKITQSNGTFSKSALTSRNAKRGAVVFNMNAVTPTSSTAAPKIQYFNGTAWNEISSSHQWYSNAVNLMAGDILGIAGYYSTLKLSIPAVCTSYICNFTSNKAFTDELAKNINASGDSVKSSNYVSGETGFNLASDGSANINNLKVNNMPIDLRWNNVVISDTDKYFGSSNSNIIIGKNNLQKSGLYQGNTIIGLGAAANVTGLSGSVVIGQGACKNNTGSGSHTAIGNGALLSNTTGSQNTAIGQWALSNNTTGSYNTAIGYMALHGCSGEGNTAIGYYAGGHLESGHRNNVFLGNQAGMSLPADDIDNCIFLGNNKIIYLEFDSNTLVTKVVKWVKSLGVTSGSVTSINGTGFYGGRAFNQISALTTSRITIYNGSINVATLSGDTSTIGKTIQIMFVKPILD